MPLNRNPIYLLPLFCLLICAPLSGSGPDLTIADFEENDYGNWLVEGEAFALGPAGTDTEDADGVSGFEGVGFANSNLGGYALEGTLTSPEFTIERPFVNFLIAGGQAGPLYLALLFGETEVRTAAPTDVHRLQWNSWDVSPWLGQRARIRLIDDRSGHEEGYLFVDSIFQSDEARADISKTRSLREVILSGSHNLQPDLLPSLGVRREVNQILLTGSFPELPGSDFDAWCYETDGSTFLGAEAGIDGAVVLIHRFEGPGFRFRLRTEVTPFPGEVAIRATPVADPTERENLPDVLPIPNLCFQLRSAARFRSDRSGEDGKGYPGFVERCFIFTEQGRTFLDQTERRKIPARPASDPENNPPWVQNYVGVWRERPEPKPDAWADTSSDRYVVPVIGTVSRDGSFLIALADDSADLMCQAWHDCLHTRPKWLPVDAPAAEQAWTMRIYLMPNDPEALMDRVHEDFPGIDALATKRITSKP
ncbi:MAG: hypothetical protein R3F07_01940 [Opitutaceae bacterium]